MTLKLLPKAATALMLAAPLCAWACFTEDRARLLDQQHPGQGFLSLAHHMHHQERVNYQFGGPAACENGLAGGFSCHGVELAGWLELPEIGGGSGADNWGWRDPDSGRLFALMGRSNGVAFVEMTDPENPIYLGNLPRPEGVGTSVWTDIKTYDHYALIVADAVTGHGMQVFDLRRLLPQLQRPQEFSHDARYSGFNRAHNIAVNTQSGFAYAVGSETCEGGLHMINVSDPLQPVFAGCFSDDGYTHDVQCVNYQGPDLRYTDREICVASNENSVTVVDVTDKSAPVMVGRHTYNHSYTHQGWFTGDQRFFVFDDELDEQQQGLEGTRTLILDLELLDNAPTLGSHIADGLSIDHNQYVVGDYIFQANYRRGLRILRINDAASADLTEVAYFDTYPESEGLGFQGAWNVFPFFDSELVLVSDINRGLFVLRVTEPEVVKALLTRLFHDRFQSF